MQMFVPKLPIMWDLSVSKLKFKIFENSQNCCFLVRNGIFHPIFLAKMILNVSCSLNLKTKLSIEAHDKSYEHF